MENQEQMFNECKIRKLLKTYGVNDVEIENFVKDLKEDIVEEVKEKIEEFDNDLDFDDVED